MVSNLTNGTLDIDVNAFIAGHSTANVLLFLFVALPVLILCLICVCRLCFSSSLNLQVRVVSEIVFWCAGIVQWLGFLARSRNSSRQISCSFSVSGVFVAAVVKYTGIALLFGHGVCYFEAWS